MLVATATSITIQGTHRAIQRTHKAIQGTHEAIQGTHEAIQRIHEAIQGTHEAIQRIGGLSIRVVILQRVLIGALSPLILLISLK